MGPSPQRCTANAHSKCTPTSTMLKQHQPCKHNLARDAGLSCVRQIRAALSAHTQRHNQIFHLHLHSPRQQQPKHLLYGLSERVPRVAPLWAAWQTSLNAAIDSAESPTPTQDSNSQVHAHSSGLQADVTATHQLSWWDCTWELQQLSHDVDTLLANTSTLQPGPALLESLAALEVSRSNVLRPSGYFSDYLAAASPQHAATAQSLQQAVGEITAPIYACLPLLKLLVATVLEAVQQLSAAAAAATAGAAEDAPVCSDQVVTEASGDSWVGLPHGLLAMPAAAAAAASLGAQAFKLAEAAAAAAAEAAHAADAASVDAKTDEPGSADSSVAMMAEACAWAVQSLQASLEALDAALNSTLPPESRSCGGSSSSSGSGSSSRSSDGCSRSARPAPGCQALRHLMVCRHVVASWLPPISAQAAYTAAAAAQLATVQSNNCNTSAQDGNGRHASTNTPAIDSPIATSSNSSNSTGASNPAASHTVRQLLQQALATLSAVSSSHSGSGAVAPLLLMTSDEARAVQPLLAKHGLDQHSNTAVQQQPQSQQSAGSAAATGNPSISSAGDAAVRKCSAFIPLVQPSSLSATTGTATALQHPDTRPAVQAAAAGTKSSRVFPLITEGPAGSLQLHTSSWLEVHPGTGGTLLLTDLVSMTERAQEVLLEYEAQQQQQQQQQQDEQHNSSTSKHGQDSHTQLFHNDAEGVLLLPESNQLQLLRVSTDVLQLLLSRHPHPGVRQQLYYSGLLPLLNIQDQLLDTVLNLRQQLAAEQGAYEQGYVQLVQNGSCLGRAEAVADLLQQLLPFAKQHAEAEWRELQDLAARQARAAGRGLRDGPVLLPWDVEYTSLALMKQLTELDWMRDLAPYFTFSSLLARIDQLLYSCCSLRLVSADAPEAAGLMKGLSHGHPHTSAVQGFLQQQQQQQDSGHCTANVRHSSKVQAEGLEAWGPHVMHLVLLAGWQPQQQQQQQQPQLLGHVMLELVSGGFPSCSLLQLPTPARCCASLNAQHQQFPDSAHSQEQLRQQQLQREPDSMVAEQAPLFYPGTVALRVPVPAAARIRGFGQQHAAQPTASKSKQQKSTAKEEEEEAALALPGPAAFQALLHELGHALSYLCPSTHLQQLLQELQSSQVPPQSHAPQMLPHSDAYITADAAAAQAQHSDQPHAQADGPGAALLSTPSNSNDLNSSSSRYSSRTSCAGGAGWLFNASSGAYSLCLLAGPPVGLDVRELTSHLFEHWARHPVSIMALSCHDRLNCPLPQHTAVQMCRLMGPPGGCSSIRLLNTLLEAQADLNMHTSSSSTWSSSSRSHRSNTEVAYLSNSSKSSSQSSEASGMLAAGQVGKSAVGPVHSGNAEPQHTAQHAADVSAQPCHGLPNPQLPSPQHTAARQHTVVASIQSGWQPMWWMSASFPPGAALLDHVEANATAGIVGGAKAAYVTARLLAAAAWKALGLDNSPLRGSHKDFPQGHQQHQQQQQGLSGGLWMAEVLLSSGGFLPSHHVVIHVLGGSADVLQPVHVLKQKAPPALLPLAAADQAHPARSQLDGDGTTSDASIGYTDSSSRSQHQREPQHQQQQEPQQQLQCLPNRVVVGWRPNLCHEVYQDVELA